MGRKKGRNGSCERLLQGLDIGALVRDASILEVTHLGFFMDAGRRWSWNDGFLPGRRGAGTANAGTDISTSYGTEGVMVVGHAMHADSFIERTERTEPYLPYSVRVHCENLTLFWHVSSAYLALEHLNATIPCRRDSSKCDGTRDTKSEAAASLHLKSHRSKIGITTERSFSSIESPIFSFQVDSQCH